MSLHFLLSALCFWSFLCAGETNHPAPLIMQGEGRPAPSTNFFETEIVAKDGTKYQSVQVRKIEPDGLRVDYSPAVGAIGSAKLKFVNLPESLQQKYGYNVEKAKAFEEAQIVANAKVYRQRQIEEFIREEKRIKQAERELAELKLEAERKLMEAQIALEREDFELRLRAALATERTAAALEYQNLLLQLQRHR